MNKIMEAMTSTIATTTTATTTATTTTTTNNAVNIDDETHNHVVVRVDRDTHDRREEQNQ